MRVSENRLLKQILCLKSYKVTGWRKSDTVSLHGYSCEKMLFVAGEVGGVCDRR